LSHRRNSLRRAQARTTGNVSSPTSLRPGRRAYKTDTGRIADFAKEPQRQLDIERDLLTSDTVIVRAAVFGLRQRFRTSNTSAVAGEEDPRDSDGTGTCDAVARIGTDDT
jgi:hypothetical protein